LASSSKNLVKVLFGLPLGALRAGLGNLNRAISGVSA
jgi:hypothetical protein